MKTPPGIAQQLEDKARRFLQEGDVVKARQHLGMLAQEHEQRGNLPDAAIARFSVASLSRILHADDDALTHFRSALALFEGLEEDIWIAKCHERILSILVTKEQYDEVEDAVSKRLSAIDDDLSRLENLPDYEGDEEDG